MVRAACEAGFYCVFMRLRRGDRRADELLQEQGHRREGEPGSGEVRFYGWKANMGAAAQGL